MTDKKTYGFSPFVFERDRWLQVHALSAPAPL